MNFIVSHQIVMGVNELSYDISYQRVDDSLIFEVPKDSMMAIGYPTLKYRLTSSQTFDILSEKRCF